MRVLAMLGAVLGLFVLVAGMLFAAGAVERAAVAAMACALAVIPYVGWRASQIDDFERAQRKFQQQLLERLEALEKSRPD